MTIKRNKPLKRSTTPRKVNPKAKAKRVAKLKKHYASAEYKAARKEAMKRAEGQCEARHIIDDHLRWTAVVIPSDTLFPDNRDPCFIRRCPNTEELEFHETHYGSKVGVIRSIKGFILCKSDQQYIELRGHPTRHQRR